MTGFAAIAAAGGDASALGAQLADRTLVAVDGGDTFSSKIPIGGVAALDPAPGTEVAVGSSVKVITSKGSPPVDIPDVKGMSENAARAALDKVGISVSTTRTTFDDAVEHLHRLGNAGAHDVALFPCPDLAADAPHSPGRRRVIRIFCRWVVVS